MITLNASATQGNNAQNDPLAELAQDVEDAINDSNIEVTVETVGTKRVLVITALDGSDIEFLDDTSRMSEVRVSFDDLNDALRIDLPFMLTPAPEETTVSLDFPSLGVNFGDDITFLIGLEDEAKINLETQLSLDLQLGIDLTLPTGAQIPTTVAASLSQNFTTFDELVGAGPRGGGRRVAGHPRI